MMADHGACPGFEMAGVRSDTENSGPRGAAENSAEPERSSMNLRILSRREVPGFLGLLSQRCQTLFVVNGQAHRHVKVLKDGVE